MYMYSNVIKRIEDQGFSDSLTVSAVETPQLYLDSLHVLHRENTIFKLVNMERHGQFYVSMYNATKRVYWKNLISFYLFILLYILLCILITSEFWRKKKKT